MMAMLLVAVLSVPSLAANGIAGANDAEVRLPPYPFLNPVPGSGPEFDENPALELPDVHGPTSHDAITCVLGELPVLCPPHLCEDGEDNDGDGRTDYPDDPGCSSPSDTSESPDPACGDQLDNDGDGRTDYPNDPGCSSSRDTTESPDPACGDGIDNDGDGRTDYPNDPGCSSSRDTSECNNYSATVHSSIATSGGGWGTESDIVVTWSYNGANCSGGPTVTSYSGTCSWDNGWALSTCNYDHPPSGRGLRAHFVCGSSSCSGLPAHDLYADVVVADDGSATCNWQYPTAAVNNRVTHCAYH